MDNVEAPTQSDPDDFELPPPLDDAMIYGAENDDDPKKTAVANYLSKFWLRKERRIEEEEFTQVDPIYYCPYCDTEKTGTAQFLTHGDCYFLRKQVEAANLGEPLESGDWKFACEICGAVVSRLQCLLNHLQCCHYPSFSCSLCDHQAGLVGRMKRHHLMLHGEPVPENCDKCEETFKSRVAYIVHAETHVELGELEHNIVRSSLKHHHSLFPQTRKIVLVHSKDAARCLLIGKLSMNIDANLTIGGRSGGKGAR